MKVIYADMFDNELRKAADRIAVERGAGVEPDPGMLGTYGFAYGQEVLIHGLKDAELNGQRAVVLPKSHSASASEAWDRGRVPVLFRPGGGVATSVMFVGVQTLPGDRVLSIKPGNLGSYGVTNAPGDAYKLGEELYWECAKGTSLNADDAPVVGVVRDLIERGADVQWEHPTNGATVLNNACMGPCVEAIRVLLQAGANPNAPLDSGGSIFYCLSNSGAPAKVKLLLDHGARPDVLMAWVPMTCLQMARNMSTSSKSDSAKKKEMLECIALMEAAIAASE